MTADPTALLAALDSIDERADNEWLAKRLAEALAASGVYLVSEASLEQLKPTDTTPGDPPGVVAYAAGWNDAVAILRAALAPPEPKRYPEPGEDR